MTRTIATLVVKKYEGLLRKVAYRCGIHQQHPNFDDYLQEGRWHLFQLASAFEDLASFEQTYSLSFLYQNLYWFFLDFQRKQHERMDVLDLYQEEGLALPSKTEENEVLEWKVAFTEFYAQLDATDQERIAALLGKRPLSRQMKAYYRQVLRKKFDLFFKSF
jgi:hypothetical protein